MKLKLTISEFTILHSLLEMICKGIAPSGMQERVLHGLLFRLYRRFYNKAILPKKKYTITIEDMEACAFYLFFSKYDMQGMEIFTINTVTTLNNKIHQKFSV